MDPLEPLQGLLGLVFLFYLLKGLLGKFQDGDLWKGLAAFVAWLGSVALTSGVLV